MNTYLYNVLRLTGYSILILLSIDGCTQNDRFEKVTFKSSQYPEPLRYLIYKPEGYREGKLYPVVVFLHGSGEIGNDLNRIRARGLPKLIDEGIDFPFVLVSPQLPISLNKTWTANFTNAFIDHIISNYSVDKNRVCLTGVSIGGTGVWEYACAFPSKISAAIPLSGWGNVQDMCKMITVPTWCFHGSDDQIVSPIGSRSLVTSLRKCGGNGKLTEFEGGGHDISRETYSYVGLWDWVLSQKAGTPYKTNLPQKIDATTKAYKLPKALNDISGIIVDQAGDFFGISGRNAQAVIFNFDTLGTIKRMIKVSNAVNLSWQDITQAENGDLFIGDFGNEKFNRSTFQVYKLKKEDLVKEKIVASKIEFTSNFPLNFRAMVHYNGFLYLFGESQLNENFLVKLDTQRGGSSSEVKLVGKCSNILMGSITSAYFDYKTSKLWLLDNQSIGISFVLNSVDLLSQANFIYQKLPNSNPKDGLSFTKTGKIVFGGPYFLGNFEGNLYLKKLIIK